MECEEARELFTEDVAELEEEVLEALREHLEQCRRCKFALRKEKSARAYADALDLDLGLKEPLDIRKVLRLAVPGVMVVVLLVLVIVYFATRPPEPTRLVPHRLQLSLEECETIEGVRDWALLPEVEVGAPVTATRVQYYSALIREVVSQRARECSTSEEAEQLRALMFRGMASSVPESKVDPAQLGNPDWKVGAASRPPAAEAWKFAEALELERHPLFARAGAAFDKLAAGASDATIKRRAALHSLYCRMNSGQAEAVSGELAKFAADHAATDQGRIAKHLLAVSQNAAAKGKAIQGKNKAMKNVPDRDLGRAAVASLDWDRAVGALSGKDVYMLATFAKAYALRRSGRAYEALDELINVRALSRDSNLAALAAVEAGRTEILLGDYDRGFSRLQDGKTKAKKLRLADAISVFMGFIYLRDYDSPTVASGFFKEITTGKQQSSIGTFSNEILMPEMQRNPRVRTGTHGISISQRVFAEDFEDKGFEEGLGKVGSEVKVTRLADAAREGRAGAGVTGFGGPGGLTIERSFKCEETVISASIKLECDAERVILSVKADDGSIYRAHIHGLPKDTWRTILFPLPALTRKSGEGVITGKTVTQTVIAVTPVAKGPVKFSVDDIIIHNGADFSLDDE